MKKLMMNTRFLHIFYLSSIVVLSYVLYCIYPSQRECRSVAKLQESLKVANAVTSQGNDKIKQELSLHTRAYASLSNRMLERNVEESDSITTEITATIEQIKQDLMEESNRNQNVFYHNYSTLPTRKILAKATLDKLKNTLYSYQNLVPDSRDKEDISKTMVTIIQTIHWEEIPYLSAASALAQLENINTKAQHLNTAMINYNLRRIGCGGGIRFDNFSVAITPKQSAIKVGDTFETDLLISHFDFQPKSQISFFVDNQIIPTENNVGHYKKRFDKTGKQSIFGKAILFNPITKQIDTIQKEYIVEVLGKKGRE